MIAETTISMKKRAIAIRNSLQEGTKHYFYNDQVVMSYSKNFQALNHDVKLLRFAEDSIGAVSDCYILYSVAMMGVADLDGIRLFLNALRSNNKGLLIQDSEDRDLLRRRLRTLYQNGFLFKHTYTIPTVDYYGEERTDNISMYSITKDGHSLMNQKLSKRLMVNEWLMAKPLVELISWTAKSLLNLSKVFVKQKLSILQSFQE